MYLLYRAALTLYDFRGDDSRKRKDELLSSLNREYASGDIVQIQFYPLGFGTVLNRWPILQTTGVYTSKTSTLPAFPSNPFLS